MRKILIAAFLFLTGIISAQKQLTVEAVYRDKAFTPFSLQGTEWIPAAHGASEFSYLREASNGRELVLINAVNGVEKKVLDENILKSGDGNSLRIKGYEWSYGGEYLLFYDLLSARSKKSGGSFHLYGTADEKVKSSFNPAGETVNIHFSPGGKYISYVNNNDLYLLETGTGREVRVTKDGSESILNGVFDWVYEEEFSIIRAYEWSRDDRYLAFWKTDQSSVPLLSIAKWDSVNFNFMNLRYPKAGFAPAVVSVYVYDTKSGELTGPVPVPMKADDYIPRIKFYYTGENLLIQYLSRSQKEFKIFSYNAASRSLSELYSEKADVWTEINNDMTPLPDGSVLLTSDKDGHNHIYQLGKDLTLKQITRGDYDVEKIEAFNKLENTVIYSSKEFGKQYQNIFSVELASGKKTTLTPKKGWNAGNFSPDGIAFINTYSASDKMPASVVMHSGGKVIKRFEHEDDLKSTGYSFQPLEFSNFTTPDGVTLNYYLIKPQNFEAGKKYPVLIYNYSGPLSQVVTDRWGGTTYLWHQLLVSKGYIIAAMDHRGTAGNMRAAKKYMQNKLGYYEIEDQKAFINHLSSLGFADLSRIGIWGWSYGGYTSALALVKAPEHFKAAISVAPVTDWKFYDNIYTERFMSTPELNPAGYKSGSVIENAENLKGNLLLVHGTADDNVHFQNAVKLAEKLIELEKPFETMFYPEKEHGIRGTSARIHLFNMMTKFILNNL